ncbi:MAG: HEAT repeat domain-containing protein [Planctomycetes bacterium]|nr:HEAT repeat domain-containing protein [Planctomycetota bacterium]
MKLAGLPMMAIVVLAAGFASPAAADVVRLVGGGEVRGQVDSGNSRDSRITISTLAGARIVLEREDVEFITRRSLAIEDYELRRRQTEDTVEAHWELAEWCRERGLRSQRLEVLERIVELDPEHEAAHRGLGHSLRDGQWLTRDEEMASRGYVKHEGDWITPQELELLQKTEAEREAELEWFRKVRLWHGWLTGRHAGRAREALEELRKIDDADAVAALVKFFRDDQNAQMRALYIEILSNLPGPKPAAALAGQALYDADYELRYAAINGIGPAQHAAATPVFVRELRSSDNVMVRRAGMGLERVGGEDAVPYLIDALVTTHRYKVRVRDPGLSFGSNGSFGSGSGTPLPPDIEILLRTGQLPHGVIVNQPSNQLQPTKLAVVKYDHKNDEVLSALRRISGKSFGFDERTWKLWWAAEKTGANAEAPKLQ